MTTTRLGAAAHSWSPVHSLSRLGISLVSFLARTSNPRGYGAAAGTGSTTGGHSEQAASQKVTMVSGDPLATRAFMACCSLARENQCPVEGPSPPGHAPRYTCPDGYYKQTWYCCQGHSLAGCGECTTDQTTCWSGDFACSIWWWTGNLCHHHIPPRR
jgi:hypothetical protein